MTRGQVLVVGLVGAAIGSLVGGLAAKVGFPPASLLSPPPTYENPVIRTDFADPAVMRAADGWYYAYATEQLTVVRMAYVQAARSRDLVHWQLLPDVLARRPSWAAASRDFWAPGAIEANGRTYMYFAAMPDSGDGMCLGVATAPHAAGPFEPVDEPLRCGEGFVNIDPMPFDDPVSGKSYLYWGSDRSPILARELAPDRTRFADGSEPVEVMDRDTLAPYEGLIEAPWVIYREGTYYLFYSGNDCCSDDPAYAVMVGRAQTPLGPFEKRADVVNEWGASVILRASDDWIAPGHCAVIADGGRQDWIVYHAIHPQERFQPGVHAVKRPMLIDRIDWRDGWPTIADEVPSADERLAPAT